MRLLNGWDIELAAHAPVAANAGRFLPGKSGVDLHEGRWRVKRENIS